jgi:hypothetical protein
MRKMAKGSKQDRKNRAKTAWKENTWIGIVFTLIGVTGLMYGWSKGFVWGGLTWVVAFAVIGSYSLLVLQREDY